jgi:hypothetical protein
MPFHAAPSQPGLLPSTPAVVAALAVSGQR